MLLEDGHCLKDHALSACNEPIRAHASMMGTSLHTLVQMVDNGLGLTFVPGMAIETGILRGTRVEIKAIEFRSRLSARRADLAPLQPARKQFQLLATTLRQIARDLIPDLEPIVSDREPALEGACG